MQNRNEIYIATQSRPFRYMVKIGKPKTNRCPEQIFRPAFIFLLTSGMRFQVHPYIQHILNSLGQFHFNLQTTQFDSLVGTQPQGDNNRLSICRDPIPLSFYYLLRKCQLGGKRSKTATLRVRIFNFRTRLLQLIFINQDHRQCFAARPKNFLFHFACLLSNKLVFNNYMNWAFKALFLFFYFCFLASPFSIFHSNFLT